MVCEKMVTGDIYVLLISVRTLAIRLTTFAFTLCESGPAPNAGSKDDGDRCTKPSEAEDISYWYGVIGSLRPGSHGLQDGPRGLCFASREGERSLKVVVRGTYGAQGSGLLKGWRWR